MLKTALTITAGTVPLGVTHITDPAVEDAPLGNKYGVCGETYIPAGQTVVFFEQPGVTYVFSTPVSRPQHLVRKSVLADGTKRTDVTPHKIGFDFEKHAELEAERQAEYEQRAGDGNG